MFMKKNAGTLKTGFRKKLTAAAAALLMMVTVMAPAAPVQAENQPVTGTTMTFNKYLVMDKAANVPNVTFSFDITAGPTSDGIEAGIDADKVNVGDVVFTTSDSTSDTVDTNDKGLTLEDTQKYAKKAVKVDFSDVTFSAPGIYRYVITELASANPADGITNDIVSTRTLDVYVAYKTGSTTELEVKYFLSTNGTTKSSGFQNTYDTQNLTLEKQVTGNQGDRDKYFKFTVDITGANSGTVYTVTGATGEITVDGTEYTNPSTLTVGAGGTLTATFYLKHDQSIVIQGITGETKYTITEEDYATLGYTTTCKLDNTNLDAPLTTGEQTMGDASHTVLFTNSKEGTVPTGILLETAPWLLLGAVVIAGLIVLAATKRRRTR